MEGGTQVSTSASYQFTLNGNRTLVAIFEANVAQYTISVSANPSNGGSVSGGGTFNENTSQTVVATANNGYHFVRWMEGGTQVSTNASYQFILTENRTLVAIFDTPDAIGEVNNTETAIYGGQGNIIIKNCVERTQIEVYTLSGLLAKSKTIEGDEIIPLNKGFYIVRCSGKNQKTTTAKVVVK
jgi:hypothetical protein